MQYLLRLPFRGRFFLFSPSSFSALRLCAFVSLCLCPLSFLLNRKEAANLFAGASRLFFHLDEDSPISTIHHLLRKPTTSMVGVAAEQIRVALIGALIVICVDVVK